MNCPLIYHSDAAGNDIIPVRKKNATVALCSKPRSSVSQIDEVQKQQCANQFQRSCYIKSALHPNYSSLCSRTLRSLRSLRFNHSNATGIDITKYSLSQ